MALIKCIDCGRDISDRAKICPGCGGPVEPRSSQHPEVSSVSVPTPPETRSAQSPVAATKPTSKQHVNSGCGFTIIVLMLAGGAYLMFHEPNVEERRKLQAQKSADDQVLTTNRPSVVEKSDDPPAWYKGSKPWSSITQEGRQEILRMRSGYEQTKAKAEEPANLPSSTDSERGKALVADICDKYHVDSFYKTPGMFGSRMVIWIPEDAWKNMSSENKQSIMNWMSSQYTNWGIGVGSVSGVDVMSDRLVVQH